MKVIEKHIEYLLLRDGHVAVPGLGTFMLSTLPSRFDGTMLMPPVSVPSFEPGMCPSEGDALAESVARALEIDMDEARSVVDSDVNSLLGSLQSGQTVALSPIGTLGMSDEGEPVFVRNISWTGSDAMGWLPAFDVKPIEVSKPEEKAEISEADLRRAEFARSLRRTASSAAAIAIIALIAFVVGQIPRRDKVEPQVASITSFASAPISEIIDRPGQAEPALVLILNTPSDAVIEADPAEAPMRYAAPDASDRYCLVVASLASRADAEEFIGEHPRHSLGVLEKDGRYRIIAESGTSIADVQAKADARGLGNDFPSTWICRK